MRLTIVDATEKYGWIIPAATLFVLVVLGLYDAGTNSQDVTVDGPKAVEPSTVTIIDVFLFFVTTSVALAGWGGLFYQYITAKPKIKGRIFNAIQAQIRDFGPEKKDVLSLLAYVYLVNTRHNSIHMLNYKLEMKINGRWIKFKIVHGLHHPDKNFVFTDEEKRELKIPDFQNNFIYRKKEPVEFGKPLHGWIMFIADIEYHGVWPEEYRLTCIDAFGEEHRFVTRPDDFAAFYLFQEIAGIEIPNGS